MSGSLIKFKKPPCISSWGTVAGRREEEGPLGGRFDISDNTDRFGKDSWEKSESEMQRMALERAILKAGMTNSDVDAVFAGDLINQCTSSSYGLMSFGIPHFGIYGACSTIAEGLILSSAITALIIPQTRNKIFRTFLSNEAYFLYIMNSNIKDMKKSPVNTDNAPTQYHTTLSLS